MHLFVVSEKDFLNEICTCDSMLLFFFAMNFCATLSTFLVLSLQKQYRVHKRTNVNAKL